MLDSKKLNLSEQALKLKMSAMKAKEKPLLQKTKALENVLDDAICLMVNMAQKIEGVRG